ncbi:uncharacterized [Tachysurus ichikawai]
MELRFLKLHVLPILKEKQQDSADLYNVFLQRTAEEENASREEVLVLEVLEALWDPHHVNRPGWGDAEGSVPPRQL